MKRLSGKENAVETPGKRLLPGMALAGMLLVSPLIGATGCSEGAPQPAAARVELSCAGGRGSEAEVGLGPLKAMVRSNCDGESVESVDVRLPCGSARFQERCTISIPVPGTAIFTRGSSKPPIEISAHEENGGAVVGLKRRI